MSLLLVPTGSHFFWHSQEGERSQSGTLSWSEKEVKELFLNYGQNCVGYLLRHGGTVVSRTVSCLNAKLRAKLSGCLQFQPEENSLTLKLVETGQRLVPAAKHLLFCDTAFFKSLPPEACRYAVPKNLWKKGVRRYGSHGLFHHWVWTKAQAGNPEKIKRVVSVRLGDRSSVAAIYQGRCLEVSCGFTAVEGIPSRHACGDLDPTIIFQLQAAGMTFRDINHLFTAESGFAALAGRDCSFGELVTEPSLKQVSSVIRYNILRYIGACLALLNGL
ncbi:MAG TPA: hypothetical protein PK644_05860, partial [bacterium]|nr:hypothetical protein [bacterium]